MYNTLASSDYGMLDEETLEPRPNYWAALLWKRTMGTRSLDPGLVSAKNVRVYAQCMRDSNGGVTLMVLNLDKTYETLLSRRESAAMGKDIQDTGGARFRVIDPPRVSPEPRSAAWTTVEIISGPDGGAGRRGAGAAGVPAGCFGCRSGCVRARGRGAVRLA